MDERERDSTITIHIAAEGDAELGLKTIARVIDALQDVYFLLGEEVIGKPYREGGPVPSDVREAFELTPTHLELGSVLLACRPPRVQQVDLENVAPAQKASDALREVLEALAGTEDDRSSAASRASRIEGRVQDRRRRRRVLETLHSMHAGPGRHRVKATLAGGSVEFDRHAAERARALSQLRLMPADAESVAWLFDLNVKAKTCRLETTAGDSMVVHYPDNVEQVIHQALGRLIRVSLRRSGTAWHLDDPVDIEPLTAMPVEQVELPHGEVHLDPPIDFDFLLDEERTLIAENEEFNIIASGKSMREVYEDAQHQLQEVWEIYADASPEMLTEGARVLQERIRRRLGGGT